MDSLRNKGGQVRAQAEAKKSLCGRWAALELAKAGQRLVTNPDLRDTLRENLLFARKIDRGEDHMA